MDAINIGKKINSLRKTKGITQQQLADKLFVTNKAVSKWESGAGLPDTAVLPNLAAALGVTTDDLISSGLISSDSTSFGEMQNELCSGITSGISGPKTRSSFRKNIFKVLICLIIISALIFGIYNIIWFRYLSITVDPLIEKGTWTIESYRTEGGIDPDSWEQRVWYYYESADDENEIFVSLLRPSYLRLGGRVEIFPYLLNIEPGTVYILISLSFDGVLFNIQPVYELKLLEWGGGYYQPLVSGIDKYGQPLGRNPGDTEEYFEKWLSIYENHYDEIMKMLEYFTEFFGELP